MLAKSIPKSQLIEFLKIHYAIEVNSVQSVPFGSDMNAFAYKATTTAHSFFVKIRYGKYDDLHLEILCFLHDSGIKEVILPIASKEGNLLKKLDQFVMTVYPFIKSENGFEKKLTKTQWIEFGKTLNKIHNLSIPSSIQNQIRKETFTTKWCTEVKSLFNHIENYVPANKIEENFVHFFKANLGSINRLVNSTEKLSKQIKPDSNHYVLCHADLHAGNILITDDESFYIVDWDYPILAPKERDLMFIGGGVGNVWNLPNEIAYFYEGYGHVDINKTLLSYYRHVRILEDIGLYGQDLLSSRLDNESKLISFKHFKSLFEPNGVIEIALSVQ